MISLAYSPCPNDTFLFYHLIRNTDYPVKEELYDVENLNEFAFEGKFPVTKLSFAAFFHIIDKYILLETGSALGRGCGPLLVRKKNTNTNLENCQSLYIPGQLTTANLLLSLYTNGTHKPTALRYDEIIPKLLTEKNSLGVIIHEERFTYEERGLEKVVDLGEWWESSTGYPIPLGAIAIRRDIPREEALKFQSELQKSLKDAYQEPKEMMDYIKENSQNKEDSVIKAHINLYVNEFTKSLGKEGHDAVAYLFQRAIEAGFIKKPTSNLSLFLGES
ncbi:menaquinone biosynthesis protein [Leptospira levettii]|uniref:1,4-dihydroxy-6-naphtoate synthase n=1 Tax=Leptospira levettii TaxID=2023178 RepID=A0A2N0AYD9_9LEPT|nr:1,4-dihydroxy-6-naphthoate synthase [Leptospira levettii]PKA28184.1 menaquinone biosynthesis protein [Leptospira sp. mixed culture ATI2-C-A1]MCW7467354.1 1,4-dihydroxy-6-naphthoate synthase [Leptospira levettii]MCW7498034.1 1,4-dihydroxy-6-naphthoate synthase [Leptospira levettii]MCW7509626.1 1,4-dihydroxy-6-naphthoate synthase [Leptospira levettii]MCW7513076.1 1,4-dihydroxy-6-naphthoate synthase [Leptospira levettii]